MIEPENVFGQMKNNGGFQRLHCGMSKVSLEIGWISLAHNFAEEVGNRPKKESG
jgi:hypothetical protein